MRTSSKSRWQRAAVVATLLVLLFTFKHGADAAWNYPGVLVVRSQLRLMRGDTHSALDLAAQAAGAVARASGRAGTGAKV